MEKEKYVPFVSEVEEFNVTMGKPNNYVPVIPDAALKAFPVIEPTLIFL